MAPLRRCIGLSTGRSAFRHVVEINPRSMGALLSLRQRVNGALARYGAQAQAAGCASLAEWAAEFETVWPTIRRLTMLRLARAHSLLQILLGPVRALASYSSIRPCQDASARWKWSWMSALKQPFFGLAWCLCGGFLLWYTHHLPLDLRRRCSMQVVCPTMA